MKNFLRRVLYGYCKPRYGALSCITVLVMITFLRDHPTLPPLLIGIAFGWAFGFVPWLEERYYNKRKHVYETH